MLSTDTVEGMSTLQFRRKLRQEMTPAEKVLWQELRGRKFRNTKWRRQASIGSFIADFRCAEHRLIIEVDGGIHEIQKDYDQQRTKVLHDYHERVLRFTNEEVLNNLPEVLRRIAIALHAPHLPTSSPQRGEEGA